MSDPVHADEALRFEAYGASVLGTSHAAVSLNNQDAWALTAVDALPFVAVVTDGVSQGRFNEVGAHLGKRIIASTLLSLAQREFASDGAGEAFATFAFWRSVQKAVLRKLHRVARTMGGPLDQVVCEYLAFSTVGALVLPYTTHFFSFGDGIRVVNGTLEKIGPFPGNKPPCIAFGLISDEFAEREFERRTIATADLQHFVIATDGAGRFFDHPGLRRRKLVTRLWEDDAFFTSPAATQWLRELNKEDVRFRPGDHERFGYFDDDTTLVTVRRSRAVEELPPSNPTTD